MEYSSGSAENTTIQSHSREADRDDDQMILEVIPVITSALDGGWLGQIGTTLILLFGTFGNVMTVIILRRLRSGWSAMNVYLTALALSDTAMLYSVALPMWSRKVLDYDIYASHVIVCKLGIWMMVTTATLSAWLLVALTAQRAASVVWPHRVNVICTRHKSVVIIVVLTGMCSLHNSHALHGFKIMKLYNGTTERCTFGSMAYQDFWVKVWVRVNMFVYSIIPSAGLIVSNAVLGWKLTVSVKEAREKFATGNVNQKDNRQKKASSVTVTIIIVSVAFVLITVPLTTYNTFFFGYASRNIDYFLYDSFFVFGLFNFAWNFYLYCLTGSKFRREFIKIAFGCCNALSSTVRSAYTTDGSQVSSTGTAGQQRLAIDVNDDF